MELFPHKTNEIVGSVYGMKKKGMPEEIARSRGGEVRRMRTRRRRRRRRRRMKGEKMKDGEEEEGLVEMPEDEMSRRIEMRNNDLCRKGPGAHST